ncbi:MAG: hypothetical protein WC516_06380 [Patescibacteria group bacterium]|jgi:hypothetical protein
MKNIKTIARNLLESKNNNGFGIKCEAVTKVLEENNITFQELWKEIIKQGNERTA